MISLKFDVSFPFCSSFSIKQVLPFVINSGVLPFSRHLFKCVIIFSLIFVNSLIQNPWTSSGPLAFHSGSLPNCCLYLTASIMISSCFLLLLTLSLTSLVYSALLLCSTFGTKYCTKTFYFLLHWVSHYFAYFSPQSFQSRVFGCFEITCFKLLLLLLLLLFIIYYLLLLLLS